MKKINFFFIFLSLASSLKAEELRKLVREEYHIDSEYVAGNNLIYDCKRLHFACVDLVSYETCEERRQKSLLKKETNFSCAPIKSFENKESCLLSNYQIQSIKMDYKFCGEDDN